MENILIVTSPEEIKKIVSESVKAALKEISKNVKLDKGLPSEEFLTRKEACKLIKCSLGTLDSKTKSGKLVAYRLGSNVRYKKSELLISLIRRNFTLPESNQI